jgi:hypothetical protein
MPLAMTGREEITVPVSRRAAWLLCSALLLLATAFRAYLLRTVFANVDSDQAVLGIMAYHIQAGERPIFYYGQPYTGSLEAYAAAILFHLFGASDWTLRLPALACSVAFVGAVYGLGARLYGYRIAVLAALFLALGPAILINWSTAAGANWSEVMLLGTALLWLAVCYPDLRVLPTPAALVLGLLAGLGVWIQPLSIEYLIPVAVAYAAAWCSGQSGPAPTRAGPCRATSAEAGPALDTPTVPHRHLRHTLATIVAGMAIGAFPLLLYNVQHGWATVLYLVRGVASGDHLAVAIRMATQSLPILLGLAVPVADGDQASVFAAQVAQHPLPYAAGVVLSLYILGRLVVGPRGLAPRITALWRRPLRPASRCAARTSCDGVLALFTLSCLLFFVGSHFGAAYLSTVKPYYLLPLYTATPLVLDVLRARPARRRSLCVVAPATAALVVVGIALTLAAPARGSIAALTRLLDERHVRVVYANDYWITYRIVFETHERVLGLGVRDDLRLGLVRLPGYLIAAAHTPADQLAWVFYRGRPAGERAFRRLLRRRHLHARRTAWGDRVIYDRLSRPVRATGPYLVHGETQAVTG